MRKNRETRVNSGFTLIELLVVIGIVGVLSSIALVALNEARAKARYTSILSQLRQLGQAALMDYYSVGTWSANGAPGSGAGIRFVTDYLDGIWPSPPCPGWTYDWDQWATSPTAAPLADSSVRITVRRDSTGNINTNSLFYYCIATRGNCAAPSLTVGGGGVDILTIANKKITCGE